MSKDKHKNDARKLIERLSFEEKIEMLSGDEGFWPGIKCLVQDSYHNRPFIAARCERLGISGLAFIDGPRGIVLHGGATTFPVSMARGASWNPALEEEIGDAIGKELRALGGNLFGGVCINLLRHPAWGRAQETYGEDTVHLGVMGSALVRGVEQHGMACIKHFAANSIENARFRVDVTMSERVQHELYLPHFKMCVDAGASAVMSAYNSVNGEWCGQNRVLLTDVLKEKWGFEGYVLTDFIFGVRDAKRAIHAGLDLEMPFPMVWGEPLARLVKKGEARESQLDEALERLIVPQLKLPPATDYPKTLVGAAEHKALAREAAVQSMVLLKNEDAALPLAKDSKIAVLGSLAATPNLGDHGSSDGRPEYVVTPLEGLSLASSGDIAHYSDLSEDGAQEAVADADAVIVVVGYTHKEEGEYIAPMSDLTEFTRLIPPPESLRWLFNNRVLRSAWTGIASLLVKASGGIQRKTIGSDNAVFGRGGDRVYLGLREEDETLIAKACQLNRKVIVALMGGSAILMERWRQEAAAIMMMWYPGMEGGHAFADLIFGDRSPSGRLPFSIPTSSDHLPVFDKDADEIEYDLWHGYRKLERDGNRPVFAFGFGLSYTSFDYVTMRCSADSIREGDVLGIEVDVKNIGATQADEVVQIYASAPDSQVERAPQQLVAFQRISLEAGETKTAAMNMAAERLMIYDEAKMDFVLEPGSYKLTARRDASDTAGPVMTVRCRALDSERPAY